MRGQTRQARQATSETARLERVSEREREALGRRHGRRRGRVDTCTRQATRALGRRRVDTCQPTSQTRASRQASRPGLVLRQAGTHATRRLATRHGFRAAQAVGLGASSKPWASAPPSLKPRRLLEAVRLRASAPPAPPCSCWRAHVPQRACLVCLKEAASSWSKSLPHVGQRGCFMLEASC